MKVESKDKKNLAITACLLAGRLLIENGSNMERVNDTMRRMALSAQLQNFEAFTTMTAIVASAEHLPNAQVIDIHQRKLNLNKVAAVNSLSRQFAAHEIDVETLYAKLQKVDQQPQQTSDFVQCVAAGVLSWALTIVYTGNVHDSLFAAVIALISYQVYLTLGKHSKVRFVNEFCASLVIALLTVGFVRLHWANDVNDIIIGCVMPLVPGVPLTNAARDLMSGDLISGTSRAVEATLTAIAIGCAIVFVLRYV